MNSLELNKLKVKPAVTQEKEIVIFIKGQLTQNIITDERDKGFDRSALFKKMAENNLTKVTVKPMFQKSVQAIEKEPEKEPEKEAEKEAEKEPEKGPKKRLEKKKIKIIIKPDEPLELPEVEIPEVEIPELEQLEIPVKISKGERKTKKVEKGVTVLGPESLIIIGDTPINKRLPTKNLPTIRVSSYYMNNREIFINFINSLFEPYKKELENKESISCENIGNVSLDFSLLTHQKIVRDYMNLYTPYRGLLLYHGLGSGKTCTSIAIAEGMKNNKRIIIMTPASLRTNYMEELKKCGDLLYKKTQYWEWISIKSNPDAVNTLATVLNLPSAYIIKKKGAWLVNVSKKSNYTELSSSEKKLLDEQLDEMIQNKYTFINYNGLRTKKLEELTSGFTRNLFDNSVIIIDEAHNLISRIVNKLKKQKPIPESERGEKERPPKFLSVKLYEYLLSATNARIVLLSGTPIINYPNEFGIMFNILRGYIKTWEIPLDVKTSKKIDKTSLQEMLQGEKTLDYLDYSPSSKILTITRNPFGFKNKLKKESGYQGVTNLKNEILDSEFINDEDFEKKIIGNLRKNDIDIIGKNVKIRNLKALPDTLELFENNYVNMDLKELKNVDSLKRRIIGLSSYFRSAQESLLPKYNKELGEDYFIVRIPMSNYQFKIYEDARKAERESESKQNIKKKGDGVYEEPSSTYRIFSRLFCNFVMPNRPFPDKSGGDKVDATDKTSRFIELLAETRQLEENQDMNANEGEVEGDEILEQVADGNYVKRIQDAIKYITDNSDDYLTPQALETYSPKFLHMLENIKDDEYQGLHLVYSQFRTLEGVGIFSLVLEKNGFVRFKIKKNNLNVWEIDIREIDKGKPTYALYTGTETAEEKEIIRNIYNGSWNFIPSNIADELKLIANNNNMGEIIKVLMITSSGSEGINLRNTRYVHIMEPYWHPVRTEQVIGRARRICSHKDLPLPLQTVNVFVYLMIFSDEQLKSDDSIELKKRDLSKGLPKVPITSDQYLYEISEIKYRLTSQLTDVIKEAAFDCNIYSNGKCMNFATPTSTKFSYVPNYNEQKSDILVQANVKRTELNGVPIEISGVKYVSVEINKKMFNIYDKASYEEAIRNPGMIPIQVGTLEISKGQHIFKKI